MDKCPTCIRKRIEKHPTMERETSCYGVGRSIGWSAIGVDAGEKKEEEKEREKDRGKTGKKTGFCKVIDAKTGCLGKK